MNKEMEAIELRNLLENKWLLLSLSLEFSNAAAAAETKKLVEIFRLDNFNEKLRQNISFLKSKTFKLFHLSLVSLF